jgi:hypothetical protein
MLEHQVKHMALTKRRMASYEDVSGMVQGAAISAALGGQFAAIAAWLGTAKIIYGHLDITTTSATGVEPCTKKQTLACVEGGLAVLQLAQMRGVPKETLKMKLPHALTYLPHALTVEHTWYSLRML